MGCCYSKEQRKIRSTDNESSEGLFDNVINTNKINHFQQYLKIIRAMNLFSKYQERKISNCNNIIIFY